MIQIVQTVQQRRKSRMPAQGSMTPALFFKKRNNTYVKQRYTTGGAGSVAITSLRLYRRGYVLAKYSADCTNNARNTAAAVVVSCVRCLAGTRALPPHHVYTCVHSAFLFWPGVYRRSTTYIKLDRWLVLALNYCLL